MTRKCLLLCPMLLIGSAAWALPVCTTGSLNVYTNNDSNNYSCTLNGLTFSNFEYTASGGLPSEATVDVMPVSDSSGDIGFIFQGAWSAGAGMSADSVLSYDISDTTAGITGATVSLLSYGASGANASATIVEGICSTAPTGSGACLPPSNVYSLSVYDNSNAPPPVQSDSVTFASPASTVWVSKNIVEVGGSGSATISSFENTVQTGGGGGPGGGPTPEPASLFTMGSGLIATSLLLRKKLKKS